MSNLRKLCAIAVVVSDPHDLLHTIHEAAFASVFGVAESNHGDDFVALHLCKRSDEAAIEAIDSSTATKTQRESLENSLASDETKHLLKIWVVGEASVSDLSRLGMGAIVGRIGKLEGKMFEVADLDSCQYGSKVLHTSLRLTLTGPMPLKKRRISL